VPPEVKKEIQLEIAHVLFIDIVAYSKMAIDDQRAAINELNQIVQSTEEFRTAEAENRLVKIATGDGMALIFYRSPENPVECALEISRALKDQHINLPLRMGVHSGPVSGVVDVNGRANIAGAGINIAQRVMDCGDAGHILLSKRVAEDLEQFKHWRPHLYHLGECEVKHGEKIEIINLFTAELGNSERPTRLTNLVERIKAAPALNEPSKSRKSLFVVAACVALAALAAAAFLLWQREAPKTSAPASAIPEKSIAVLPFENFSADQENAFFADGVQDDILTALAKVSELKVISRTSVISYAASAKRNLREIGQSLGVAHVLEGSVRRAGNQVRVTAQLVDTRTDSHLWADTYDRDLADVFAIQTEIAKTIADQLRAKLSPNEKAAIEEKPTTDIAAHDLYVRAKLLYESSSFNSRRLEKLVEAAGLLDQAISRDPNFLLAYCLLSNTQSLIYFYGLDHTPSRRALAEAAINSASRLSSDAGETHLARADFYYRCYLDYDRAGSELALAQRSLPNNAQIVVLRSYIARRQGRWNESIQDLQRALELDPRNWFYLQQMSLNYWYMRRFADQASVLDRAKEVLPNDAVTRVARARIDAEWRADSRPLHEAIEAALKEDPTAAGGFATNYIALALYERDPKAAERAIAVMPAQGINVDQLSFPVSFWKGLVARMQGDSAGAKEAFSAARHEVEQTAQKQPDYAPAFCLLGLIDAALGRKDDAITEGRKAVELLPKSKDTANGTHMVEFLAVTYAWAGEKDLAIEQLRTALQSPGIFSYGHLKLHPFWDPLRDDPRFEQLVASLAPK
jgi:TolB-like protein/class 3 adenylate cyclase/Flp pilus assembly protein TadD